MIIHSHWQGQPTLLIDAPLARCEISLQGAQVLSFIPKSEGRDLLWCSPARLQPGRPVRGGIPICWPWFSRQGQAPTAVQHGFARRMPWTLRQATEAADGTVQVVLELVAPQGGWPQSDWPAACTAELHLEIAASLTVHLISRNDSDTPVRLTQALHTYLRWAMCITPSCMGLRAGITWTIFKAWRVSHSMQPGSLIRPATASTWIQPANIGLKIPCCRGRSASPRKAVAAPWSGMQARPAMPPWAMCRRMPGRAICVWRRPTASRTIRSFLSLGLGPSWSRFCRRVKPSEGCCIHAGPRSQDQRPPSTPVAARACT